MIIDIHAHMGKPRDDMDKVVAGMQAIGIVKCVVFGGRRGGNLRTLEITRKYPDFFIPFAYVQLGEDSAESVTPWFEQGFKGIKFHHPKAPYNDRSYWPIYEKVNEQKGIALFHSANMSYTQALLLSDVAKDFEDIRIVIAHMGKPHYNEGANVSQKNKNVWCDLSTNQWLYFDRKTGQAKCKPQIKALYETQEMEIGKMLFGSDVFYGRPEYTSYRGEKCDTAGFVKSVIEDHREVFADLGLSSEEQDRIFYGNAAELLGKVGVTVPEK